MIYKLIYNLSKKELKVLREDLKINLKKEFIQLSKLLIEYSIIFILKVNEKLKLYIDYKQLNSITIKNRYLLFLISELVNKIKETQIFTILNL